MSQPEYLNSVEEAWIKERDRVLVALDGEAFQRMLEESGAGRISSNAVLPAMHKTRYECVSIDPTLRRESGQWLLANGYKDRLGRPIDPTGRLPC